MTGAWKVGVFVVGFAVLLVLGFNFVGESLKPRKQDLYYAKMSDAGDILPGATILMAGVRVGHVKKVRLEGPTEAVMELLLDEGTYVPKDAVLIVPASLFAIGDQKLELISSLGKDAGRLPVGSTIPGKKTSVLESYLPGGETTIEALNANLLALKEILGDTKLRENLSSAIESADESLKQMTLLMKDARGVIAQNGAVLNRALKDAALAVNEMREGIANINALVTDTAVKEQIKETLTLLTSTVKSAEEVVINIAEFTGDPELKARITETLDNVEAITKTGIDVVENTKAISEDGKVISAKAIEIAEEVKELTIEAKQLIEKLSQFVDRLPGEFRVERPTVYLEAGNEFKENRFQTDVLIEYPVRTGASLFGGIYDITETNRLTLQYGQFFGNTTLRYGVYASKPGVGVDYYPFDWMGTSLDVFDPNDLQLNVRARFFFKGDWYGWLGMNRLFHRNEPYVGFGVKR